MSLLRPEIILGISRLVGKTLGRVTTDDDNLFIATRLMNLSINKFKRLPVELITKRIAESIAHDLSIKTSSLGTTVEPFDMDGWQNKTLVAGYAQDQYAIDTAFINRSVKFNTKKYNTNLTAEITSELSINTVFDLRDLHTIQRIVAPTAQHRSVFVLLDTSNADPVLSSGNKFGWSFIDSPLLKEGMINGIGGTGDLVGMRLFPINTTLISQPSATFVASAVPLVVSNVGQSPFYSNDFLNTNNNFTILIDEFSAQSYVGRDGRKFHFSQFPFLLTAFTVVNLGSYPSLNPYYEFVSISKGDGWFWFRKPITEFSTLTISMATPFTVMPLSQTTRTIIPIELIFLES